MRDSSCRCCCFKICCGTSLSFERVVGVVGVGEEAAVVVVVEEYDRCCCWRDIVDDDMLLLLVVIANPDATSAIITADNKQ